MRAAADLEDRNEKHIVTPGRIVPAAIGAFPPIAAAFCLLPCEEVERPRACDC